MSTIRLLTSSTDKSGEKTIRTDELASALKNINSGWLDILNPGEAEKQFMLENLNFHPLAVEDCFTDPVDRAEHYENHRFVVLKARDTYLSQVSVRLSESNARLSEVMTTLTVIGSIMLPLSLIAGVAGMNVGSNFNFNQIMLAMTSFASIMLFYFYRKGWIGPQE